MTTGAFIGWFVGAAGAASGLLSLNIGDKAGPWWFWVAFVVWGGALIRAFSALGDAIEERWFTEQFPSSDG